MVGYVLLGICLLVALLLLGKWLVNVDPAKLARSVMFVFAGVIGAAALFFVLTGRLAFGLGLLFLMLPIFRRWGLANFRIPFPNFANLGARRAKGGKTSTVDTEYLSMGLSHDDGAMSGEVLKGKYAGMQLAQMSQEQLRDLFSICEIEDPEAAQLLQTYLERTQDNGDAAAGEDHGARRSGRGWGKSAGRAAMGVSEARDILGVKDGATEEEIKDAHRRLMLKNHPDRGGSDFLAAKINQAKDILLGL